MSHRHVSWSLADLTELDFRLRGEIPLNPSDRTPGQTLSREAVIQHWLREQQRMNPGPAQAALRLVGLERMLRWTLFGGLFLSGAAAAAALLQYEGDRLINVSLYLGTLVFGQLALLLMLALSKFLLSRRAGTLYHRLLFHLVNHRSESPSGLKPFRSLRAWRARAFTSMQWAAGGFNLGILTATFLRGVTRDLAFGWATTLDVGVEGMARLTSALAAPWGGLFAPSPEQIALSRIVLKEGLGRIDPRAAASWWPFLMMCVIAYGFIPRLILGLGGRLALRRCLRGIQLNDPVSERLFLRLTRKPLQFQADVPAGNITAMPALAIGEALRPAGPVQVMPPRELALNPDALVKAVASLLEVPVVGVTEPDIQPHTFPPGGGVMIQELWQPPLEETLHRIRSWRDNAAPHTPLTLIGIGFPEEGRLFTAPSSTDIHVWQHALSRLSDPHVQLIAWPG